MKVLSIKQPWASLIVHGYKDVENRTWRTNYRGPLIIHASARRDYISLQEINELYDRRLVPLDLDTPLGGVVGIVDLVDCVERHPSRWFYGPFGFVMARPRRLPFLSCPGQLNIYPPARLVREHCER